jgi:hypothetical protein
VQIFGDPLTLAKYSQKEWPSERGNQVVGEMLRQIFVVMDEGTP